MSKEFNYKNDDYERFAKYRDAFKNGEMSSRKAAECCKLSQSAFLYRVRKYESQEPCEMVLVTRLHALRSEIGISAENLAKISGLDKSAIHAYEAKKRNPSRSASIMLCRALGVDTSTNLTELVQVPRHFLRKNARTFSKPEGK